MQLLQVIHLSIRKRWKMPQHCQFGTFSKNHLFWYCPASPNVKQDWVSLLQKTPKTPPDFPHGQDRKSEACSPPAADRSAAPLDPCQAPRDHQMHYSRSPEKSRLGFKMCFYLFSLCLFQEAVLDHSREILEKSPLFILVPPRTLNRLFRTFFIHKIDL